MVTDNQRREVAQELRELRHTTYYSEEIVENICDAISIADPANTFREPEDVYKLLADLIEPEPELTCKVTYEYSGKQFPHCIHVKELSCGHEFRYYEPSHVPNYCPECGARVVS